MEKPAIENKITSEVVHIRPSQLLSIPDNFSDEMVFFMPSVRPGSLYVLESVMLVKLLRCVNPASVFEFGTLRGETTRLLLDNLSASDTNSERVYTLDLPALDNVVFQGDGEKLAIEAVGHERVYLRSKRKNLVKQILHDSMTFDPQSYLNKFQYIFIDANHAYDYVKIDTENSLKMISSTSASCIIWHDYGNPEYPELTQYLDDLSSQIKLYHIENTMLVFSLSGIDVPSRK